MASNVRRRNGYRRNQAREWLKSQHRPCWICQAFGRSGEIDYTLPPGDPMSFECDELVPVSKGGDPLDTRNLAAAHRRCNQWRGNKSVEAVYRIARAKARKGTKKARKGDGGEDVLGASASDWL